MEFEEIAKKAYKKEPISEYASYPEKNAYLKLEILYDKYRYGGIKDEDAIKQKNKIRNEYNGELLNYNRDQEVYKEYNNNRLLCEDIIRGIDMTKDKDEMLILALKAISLLIKDDYFGQRNLEKLNWL